MNIFKTHFFRTKSLIFLICISLTYSNLYSQSVIIGNGTNINSSTSYPAPYGNYYEGAKHQFLIRASEITSNCGIAGNITAIGFNAQLAIGVVYENFTIRIKETSVNVVPVNFDNTGLTTVFGPTNYTDITGWNMHSFTTPFNWNGTSNLLVEVCFNNTSWTNNTPTYYSTTSFYSSLFYRADNQTVCSNLTGTISYDRPNIRFIMNTVQSPSMSVSSNQINYGFIQSGQTKTDSLYIKNTNCGTLNITNITSTGGIYSIIPVSGSVLKGDSLKVKVSCSPTNLGVFNDTLKIFTNAGNSQVILSGECTEPPIIGITPTSLNPVINSCSSTLTVPLTINNTGSGPLEYSIEATQVFFYEGFESGNLNQWELLSTNATPSINDSITYSGNYSLLYDCLVYYSNNEYLGMKRNIPSCQPKNISYYFNSDPQNTNTSGFVSIGNSSDIFANDGLIYFEVSNWNSNIYFTTWNNWYSIPFVKGEWQHIEIRNINYITKTLDIYLNGSLIAVNEEFYNNTLNEINTILIGSNNQLEPTYFDEFLFSSPGYTMVSFSPLQGTVSPSSNQIVDVTFNSNGLFSGSYICDFFINSNDQANSHIYVPCTLTVNGTPNMNISFTDIAPPSCLDLDSIMTYTSSFDSILVSNTGCHPLVLNNLTVTGSSFSVFSAPDTIFPLTSGYIKIKFLPTTTGNKSGTLQIFSNDYDTTICLKGSAFPRPVLISNPPNINVTLACDETVQVPVWVNNSGGNNLNLLFDASGCPASIFTDNFETGNLNKWTMGTCPTVFSVISGPSPSGNKHLRLTGNCSNIYQGIKKVLPNITPSYVSFYAKSSSTTQQGAYFFLGNNTVPSQMIAYFFFNSNGTMGLSGGTANSFVPFTANQWYHIEFKNINFITRKFDFYVDDVLIYANYPFRFNMNNISYVMLNNSTFSSPTTYFDNIRIGNCEGIDWMSLPLQQTTLNDTIVPLDTNYYNLSISSLGLNNGVYSSNLTIYSNDPLNSMVTIPCTMTVNGTPHANITLNDVSQNCLYLDSIMNFANSVDSIIIFNSGCDTLKFENIIPTPSPTLTVLSSPSYILPEASGKIFVKFSPTTVGTHNGTLVINTNEIDTTICLKGYAIQPSTINIVPTNINKTISCNSSFSDSILIYNTGQSNLIYSSTLNSNNRSAFFDGVNDIINTPLNLDMGSDTCEYTIEMWVYPTRITGTNIVFSTSNYSNTAFYLSNFSGKWRVGFNGTDMFSLTNNVDLNQWQHMSVVIKPGVSGKVYKNGQLLYNTTTSPPNNNYSDKNIRFGADAYNAGSPFAGRMDEIRIWKKERTQAQILSNMYSQVLVSEPDLEAYWHFDDSTATDFSSNSYNGTFFGGTYCSTPNAPVYFPYGLEFDHNINDTILSGDSIYLNVNFSAQNVTIGQHNYQILIESNDPVHSPDTVSINVNVTGSPEFRFDGFQTSIAPSCLYFDTTWTNFSKSKKVYFGNLGCDTLVIDSVKVSPSVFSVNNSSFILLPGNDTSITVNFNPISSGTSNGSLLLYTNDIDTAFCLKGISKEKPTLCYNPDTFNLTLGCNNSTTVPLLLCNSGESNLSYSISNLLCSSTGLSETFESGIGLWSYNYCMDYTYVVEEGNAPQGNKSLKVSGGCNNTADGIWRSIGTNSYPTYFSFWAKSESTNLTGGTMSLRYSNGADIAYFRFYGSGTMNFYGSTATNYQANTWYLIEMRNINYVTHTFDFYVNNLLIDDNVPFLYNASYISNIYISNTSSASVSHWDHIKTGNCSSANWLTLPQPPMGIIQMSDTTVANLSISSSGVTIGQYSTNLLLNSNDNSNYNVTIPFNLNVIGLSNFKFIGFSDQTPSNCLYLDSIMEFTSNKDTIFFSNLGCDTLFIDSLGLISSEFTINSYSSYVLPNDTGKIIINFNPLTTGSFSSNLNLYTNETDTSFCLFGKAFERPIICVNPDPFNVTMGCNDNIQVPLNICNSGGNNLILGINPTSCLPTLFSDNFESGNLNQWTFGTCSGYSIITGASPQGNKHLRISGSCTSIYQGIKKVLPPSTPGYVSFYAKSSLTNAYGGYFYLADKDNPWEQIFLFWFKNNGTMGLDGLNGTIPFTANQWYHIEIKNIDFNNQVLDFYIDGNLIAEDFPFKTNIANITCLIISNYNSTTTYFDDIKILPCEVPGWTSMSSSFINDTIVPGDTASYLVNFNSNGIIPGTYTNEILISNNDPLNSSIVVPVNLNISGLPDFKFNGFSKVQSNCLYLDSIMEFTTNSEKIFVKNTGCDSLRLENINFSIPEFSLESASFPIAPGDSGEIEILFSPGNTGNYTGIVNVFTNELDTTFCLSGKSFVRPVQCHNPNNFSEHFTICADTLLDTLNICNTGLGNLNYSLWSKNGRHLNLNGSGAYFSVPDNASLRLTNAFTLEAWINPSSLFMNQQIISKFQWTNNYSYQLNLTPAGNLRIDVSANGTTYSNLISAASVASGVWSHVAATWDGQTIKLFINGIEDANTLSFNGPLFGAATSVDIGRVSGSNNQLFYGLIDEVKVFDRALTSSEIGRTYFNCSTGNEAGLMGYWTFDNNTGNDLTTNNNHGTLNSGAIISTPNILFTSNTGTILPSSNSNVQIEFIKTGLAFGTHTFQIYLGTNDPLNTVDTIVTTFIIDSVAPPAPPANNVNVCFGDPTPPIIANPLNALDIVNWYDNTMTLIFSGDTLNTGQTAVGNYKYYYNSTDFETSCLSQTDSVYLQINSAPSEPVSENMYGCFDNSIPVLISTGTNPLWYSDPALTNLVNTGTLFDTQLLNPGTYVYYVSDSVGGCPKSPADTVSLTIYNLPSSPVSNNVTACAGGIIPPLTATASGTVSIRWYNSAMIPVGNGPSYNTGQTAAGVYQYYVTSIDTITLCESYTSSVTLTIFSPPLPTSSNVSGCFGSSIPSLTATGSNIQWYDSTMTFISSGNSLNTGYTNIGSYPVYVTQTVNSCQSNALLVTLNIYPNPPAPVATNETTCFNETTPALISTGTNVQWYNDPALINLVANGNSFNTGLTAAGSYTYYVTQTALGCESLSDTVYLVINPLPITPVSDNQVVCFGNPVPDLIANSITGSNTVQWYSDPLLSSLVHTGNPFATLQTAVGNYVYYVTQTDLATGCRSQSDMVSLTINSAPLEPTSDDVTICFGAPQAVLSSTGSYPQWYNNSSLSSVLSSGNLFNTGLTVVGSYTFYVTDSIPGCPESPADTVMLTINPIPDAPVSSPQIQSICLGDPNPSFNATGTNIEWWGDPNFINLLQSGSSFTPTINTPGNYFFFVTQTENGCHGFADTIEFIINYTPAPTVNDISVPFGFPVPDLTAIGNNIQWYDENMTLVYSGSPYTTGITNIGIDTFYVSQTINNCESILDTLILTIYPGPPSSIDQTICSGQPVPDLTATGTNLLWYSDPNLSTLIGSGNTFVSGETATGIYTYYVTQTINSVESPSDTVTLTINAIPLTPTVTNQNVCAGSNIPDLTAIGTNIQWYDSTMTLIFSGDTFTTGVNLPGTYIYYVTQSTNGCESNTIADTLIIRPLPNAPVASNDTVVCYGDSIHNLFAAGNNITWYDNTGFLIGSGNYYTPSVTLPGAYIFIATQTDFSSGCESQGDSVILTINSSLPPIATDVASCFGQPVPPLTASGSNLQWYDSTGVLVYTGNVYNTGQTAIGTYTYYVTETTTGLCESPQDTVILTISSPPTMAPSVQDVTACFGTTIPDLVATTGSIINWYSDATLSNLLYTGNPFSTGMTLPGTYNYYVADSTSGCSEGPSALVSLVINDIPATLVVNDTTICFGSISPVLSTPGMNVQWFDTSMTLLHSGNTFITGMTSAGIYLYLVTQSDFGTGCSSIADSITLTIHALPLTPVALDTSVCSSSTIPNLTASGSNIHWNDTTNSFLYNGNSFATGNTSVGIYTYYVISVDSLSGCESIKDTSTLTILQSPPNPIANDMAICYGNPVPNLTSTGTNVLWYSDSVLSNLVNTGNTFNTGQTLVGTYTYFVIDSIGSCFSGYDSVTLSINSAPNQPVANDLTICYSEPSILTATGINPRWYKDVTLLNMVGTGNTYNTDLNAVGTYTYYVTDFEPGCGNSTADVVILTINPKPLVTANTFSTSVHPGESVNLIAYNAVTYVWAPPTGLNTTTGSSVIASPDVSTTYTVTGTNSYGCSSDTSIFVLLNPIGIEEVTTLLEDLRIYPNPASKQFTIEFSTSISSPIQIYLTNVLGEKVLLMNIKEDIAGGLNNYKYLIDTRSLSDGFYSIEFITNKGNITKRIVLKK